MSRAKQDPPESLTDEYSFPEIVRALGVIGVSQGTINTWVTRGQVFGIPKSGPGIGGRRSYSVIGVFSIALAHGLLRYKFTPETMARNIIPGIFEQMIEAEGKGKNLQHIWAVELDDPLGPVVKVILSDEEVGEGHKALKGLKVLSKIDLGKNLLTVSAELEKITTERGYFIRRVPIGSTVSMPKTMSGLLRAIG